jgi:hypothetical protein
MMVDNVKNWFVCHATKVSVFYEFSIMLLMIVETNLHKTSSMFLTSTRYTLDEAHLHRLG